MKANSLSRYIDINLWLLLAGFYSLFDLVYIGKLAFFRTYYPMGREESWGNILLYMLIDWVVIVCYMGFIAISTKRLLHKKYSWVNIISIHTVLSIFIGFIIRFVFDLFGILSGDIDPGEYQLEESLRRFMYVIDVNFLIYFAMVFIIYIYYYIKQVKEAEEQKNLLENQLVDTRMKMLFSQLQPHFLFNTLNSISVLADLNPKKAKDTIADLSDFLREILYFKDQSEISLEKELKTLNYYLNILNIRFSGDLKIKKEIDEGLLHYRVPALLLQPLIENSIKHGYSYNHAEIVILIRIQTSKNYINIKVQNDGAPLSSQDENLFRQGVGLQNIKDRLYNLYGKDFFFEIKDKQGGGVETIIQIPKRKATV